MYFFFQGINGILADEMGLGKTVQSIALLAHLAEVSQMQSFCFPLSRSQDHFPLRISHYQVLYQALERTKAVGLARCLQGLYRVTQCDETI